MAFRLKALVEHLDEFHFRWLKTEIIKKENSYVAKRSKMKLIKWK